MGEPKEPMPPMQAIKDKQDVKDKSGGTPFDGGKDSAGKNASGKEEPMGTDPNKEFLDRSTELQLEKLRKVDPETLKDLKMTPGGVPGVLEVLRGSAQAADSRA
jgi:hypothetical protein